MKTIVLIPSLFVFVLAALDVQSAPVPKRKPIAKALLFVDDEVDLKMPERAGLAIVRLKSRTYRPERNEIYIQVGEERGGIISFYPRSRGKLSEDEWHPMKQGRTLTIVNNTLMKWDIELVFYPGVVN